MRNLCNLISSSENWLVNQVIHYAKAHNFTKYSSTLSEAWRMSIVNLSDTIISALQNNDNSLELDPDENYVLDPIAAYGITQAKKHRVRGISLGMFLGLFKYYRQSYLDLVKIEKFEQELSEFYCLFISRIFDRIEIGVCLEWAKENEINDYVAGLQNNNRIITNEKNKYLTICESLPNPTILLDENNQIDYMNHSASVFLNSSHNPGANYYNFKHAQAQVPWLIEELNTFTNGHEQELFFEKRINVSDGTHYYEIKMKKMLDISGKFNGTVISMNDITERIKAYISRFAVSAEGPLNLSNLFKEADNNMYREKLYHSQSSRSAIVKTLMKALEARDYITEGHADRLQTLVSSMASFIGLPEQKIIDLRLFAQFHDIGKVGIPDRILFKAGPLTAEEFTEMQRHCEIGYRIAKSAPDLNYVADWILNHHEWWDGQGYPLGLQGEEIPLECRILAITDAYDAMTSHRPYRKAMLHEEALQELKKCANIQFDPQLVQAFIKVIEERP